MLAGSVSYSAHVLLHPREAEAVQQSTIPKPDGDVTPAATIALMPSSDGGVSDFKVSGELTFYDSGGESGKTPQRNNSLAHFTPTTPGKVIEIEILDNDLSGGSRMKLYSGSKPFRTITDDLGEESFFLPDDHEATVTSSTPKMKFTSTDASGALTVGFESTNAICNGWKAIVREVDKPSLPTNEVKISSTHQEVKVDKDINFYDNGGPTGKCTEGFKGSITFVPTTPGKKVMLEFKEFDIFNTSSVGNNDVFKVYHGKEAKEAQLQGQYSVNPFMIKSIADDGALTITFEVRTGIPKNGWHIIVKEFTPEPMTMEVADCSQEKKFAVPAGATKLNVMKLRVTTKETKDPLELQSVRFTTKGSDDPASDIATADLWCSGAANDFSQAVKVGDGALSPNGEFTLNAKQTLREGDNFFWLTYNLNDKAVNGHKLDATCEEVTLSGKKYTTTSSDPFGNHTVSNIYRMAEGKHTQKIFGEWGFTDDDEGLGKKYSPTTNLQSVTFTPMTPGHIMQLDFSKFDVNYSSSSSYGVRAQFEIYSGTEAIPAKLLWKLDNSNQAKVGPGKTLRSKDGSGAITVVFNTKSSSSSYTSAGWEATIKEYKSTDMKISSLKAEQPLTETIKPGSTDVALMRIGLEAAGDLSPIDLTAFNLKLKGCASAITKAKIYSTGTSTDFSNASLWGSTETIGETISIQGKNTLEEGKTNFWLAVDVAEAAPNGTLLDASCTSIEAAGKTIECTEGDPDGSRRVVNELNLAAGVNPTKAIDDFLMFYDDGGKTKNHSNSFEGTITFVPTDKTKSIKMEFSAFELEKADMLKVYAGKEVKDEALFAELYGKENPKPIVSPSDDGAFTLRFKSDRSVNKLGWEAMVSSVVPQALKVTNIVASHPTTNPIVRGSKEEQLLKVAITTQGDKGEVRIDKLKMKLKNSAALEKAQLFYTGTNDFFATTQTLGQPVNVTGDEITFSIDQSISKPDTYYYWVTADTKSAVAPNTEIDAALTAVEGTVPSDAISVGDPQGSRSFEAGVKGSFTIGTSANASFKTFADAIASIKNGIEGDVTFDVEPGEYTEVITIPHINGTSENAKIRFKSQSGEANDVKIKYDSYVEPEYGKDPNGVFNIAGADYVSIENMSISTNDPKFEALIYVTNKSQHATVKGCKLSAKMTTSYTEDIALIKTKANNIEGQNNDYLTLEDNTFTGGYMGVNLGGTGYVSLTKEKGCAIRNNTFIDQGSKGLYTQDEDGLKIEGNIIKNYSTTKDGFQGMDIYRSVGSSVIAKNSIIITQARGAKGIECRPMQGSASSPATIANNQISIEGKNGNETGILLNSESFGINALYNTIRIGGQSKDSRALSVEGRGQSLVNDIKVGNNLLQNAGGLSIYIQNEAYLKGLTFESNGYFSAANTLALVSRTAMPSYKEWSGVATDSKSIEKQAEFYTNEDLHLKSSEGFNIATPAPSVTEDMDGDTRSTTAPFVGADEYNAPDTEAPVMQDGYPKVKELTHEKATVEVNANESGKCYYILLDSKATKPSSTELKEKGSSLTLTAKRNLAIALNKMNEHSEYALYIALEDVFGNISSVHSVPLATKFRPTEVSTFEGLDENTTDFTDGTAKFTGFKVVKGEGARRSSSYAQHEANAPASIQIINTDKGLTANGFFVRSAAPVTFRCLKGDGTKSPAKTVSYDKWTYVCLLDQGDITGVEFDASTATIDIDNFSGKPEVLSYSGKHEYSALQNEKFSLKATFDGGALPINIKWKELKTGKEYQGDVFEITPQATGKLLVSATDAFGQESSAEIVLKVEGIAEVATFEDLNLAPESRWWGYDKPSQICDYFYSGSYKFNNYLSKEIATWSGFGYSTYTSTDFSSLILDQFKSAAGHGVKNSKTYGVVYTFGFKNRIEVTNKPEGDVISGTYVTNSAWVASVIRNGDSMTGDPFKTGDWVKVTATGYDAEGAQTATSDFYLADYRSNDPKEHKLHTDWVWWDLTSLGKVKQISFKVDGSRSNSYGLTIPAYFCIDNFNGPDKAPYVAHPIEAQTISRKSQTLLFDLNKVFADDDAPAGNAMTFEVVSNSDNELCTVSVNGSSLKVVSSKKDEGSADITVRATSEGVAVEHTFKVNRIISTKQASEISWTAPDAIRYGEALSERQLNATANVAGVFTYTPEAGTVLAAGKHEILASFTPNDIEGYDLASTTIEIVVNKAPLSISKPSVKTSKLHDGNATASIIALGDLKGVLEADRGNVGVTAIATYDNASAGKGKTITVAYTLTGSAAASYLAPASATIANGSIFEPITFGKPVATYGNGCDGKAVSLAFTTATGAPSEYQLIFDGKATAAGFISTGFSTLPTDSQGNIAVRVPAGTSGGTYNGMLQLRDELGNVSLQAPFTLTIGLSSDIIKTKFGKVVLVDNSSSSYSGYQWYKDGNAIAGATKQFYNDPKGLNGSYHVQVTTATGESLTTCNKELSLSAAQAPKVSVFPNPVKAGVPCTVKIEGVDESELNGATLLVYSAQGVPVFTSRKVEPLNTITLNESDGMLIGRLVTASGQSLSFKIIVTH